MRAFAVVAIALLAGCASPEGIGFGSESAPPDPYYKEYRELLSGEHHRVYELPVEDAARELNVTITLDARTNGLPLPDATPARLRVALLGPDGAELATAQLDPQTSTGNITLEAPAAGLYLLRVDGVGASQPVEGESYGAAYMLVSEVLYG